MDSLAAHAVEQRNQLVLLCLFICKFAALFRCKVRQNFLGLPFGQNMFYAFTIEVTQIIN